MSPATIFRFIRDQAALQPGLNKYVCVVLGKVGPTGKTWIAERLREIGFTAVEISEHVTTLVEYTSNRNYYMFDHWQKLIIIVLNEPLEKEIYSKK